MNNSSSNPSDYQFLLKSLIEGNQIAKAQSLKRFNVLVLSDKKQFSSYAKRIVIAMQDLLTEPKQDINLLAGTLVLEIINLNPRDIEFYIKSKLIKYLVINLGDLKPQIRKTSHYCLLGYIRTFKNFDDLIEVYINHGILSSEWQLRQKSINSFQSILVMEIRYLNWYSNQFKKIFQILLIKLKDQNGFVQKAAQQCLLSLSKVQQLRDFSKKLSPTVFMQLKNFCQHQVEIGNLHEVKLDKIQKKNDGEKMIAPSISILNSQKSQKILNDQSYRKKVPTPKFQQKIINERSSMRKAESTLGVNHKELQQSLNLKQTRNPERLDRSLKRQSSLLFPPIVNVNPNPTKQQKLQLIVGKKLLQDLRNDKDWKVRLQAIEQLQTKFQISKEQFQIEVIMKNLLPILIRLMGDANFKIALIALKIIQDIIKIPQVNLQAIGPQIVDKLNDNKVALRQNISKLIKKQYMTTKNPLWLDYILIQVKKTANSNVKQQILNILAKVYEDGNIPYSFQKILQSIHPLMDDLKTKIKIKTLDLLATITIRSQKLDRAKTILATKLNQVYYEMYLQKIGKELKVYRQANPTTNIQKQPTIQRQKPMGTSMNQLSRRISKIGNTTSTSLQRIATKTKDQQNSTVKTAFYQAKIQSPQKTQNNTARLISQINDDNKVNQILQIDNISINTDEQISTKKKNDNKFLRRRYNKSVQSRLLTTNYSNDDAFPPFNDPAKELKNILIEIKSDDWQISNEALNKCRRIILNHSQLLVGSTLKLLVPDIMKLAQSLRSTLSKNGLVVINELSSKVQKQLDPQFDMIFSKLIKKSLDANSFISQEVKKSLITICSNCNEFKVVNSLNATHTSRAIPIKTAIVNIIQGVAFLPRFYEKELQKIVTILVDFMSQGSLQIRQKTKIILNNIIMSQKGQSIIKLIPTEHKNKLKKRQSILGQSKLQLQSSQILNQEKKSMVHQQPQSQQMFSKKKKRNKILDFPAEFQMVDSYLENCESSDWKTRLQNMTLIAKVCFQYPQEALQHKSNSRIADVLSKQINDPNLKVAVNALKIFQQITYKIPSLVEGSLSVILNEIFICFSSSKAEIKTLSQVLFDSICKNVENWMLTQHLCNGAIYGIQKSKPIIVLKLAKLIPSIYKVKPNIFQKNVYPMINKLAEQNKPEINSSLRQLLQILYSQVGEQCMSYLKQKAKSLIVQQ